MMACLTDTIIIFNVWVLVLGIGYGVWSMEREQPLRSLMYDVSTTSNCHLDARRPSTYHVTGKVNTTAAGAATTSLWGISFVSLSDTNTENKLGIKNIISYVEWC